MIDATEKPLFLSALERLAIEQMKETIENKTAPIASRTQAAKSLLDFAKDTRNNPSDGPGNGNIGDMSIDQIDAELNRAPVPVRGPVPDPLGDFPL